MSGRLREIDYQSLKERRESDQQQLSSYTEDEPTYIAVVSCPRDTGIEEYCDEWWPELGIPERHLQRFWSYRAGFSTNSAVDNPVQRAYDEARLDYHYGRHIRTSDDAQQALSELVSRLDTGEDITLVCFEERHEACHRHQLIDIIETRLESEYCFRQKQLTTGRA